MKKQIAFNGAEYPIRTLPAYKFNEAGEEIIISTLKLYDALHPNEWGTENDGFASREAEVIYDDIYYFVDDDEINLPCKKLLKVIQA